MNNKIQSLGPYAFIVILAVVFFLMEKSRGKWEDTVTMSLEKTAATLRSIDSTLHYQQIRIERLENESGIINKDFQILGQDTAFRINPNSTNVPADTAVN